MEEVLRIIALSKKSVMEIETPEGPKMDASEFTNDLVSRLGTLAKSAGEIAETINDEESDPVAIITALNKMAYDSETIARCVCVIEPTAGVGFVARARDLQHEDRGTISLCRRVVSGVYKFGNGAECVPVVKRILEELCDLLDDMCSGLANHTTKIEKGKAPMQ